MPPRKSKKTTEEKKSQEAPQPEQPKEQAEKKPNLNLHLIGRHTVLYKMAVKAGFSAEQIDGFGSEEKLKEAIRTVRPDLLVEIDREEQEKKGKRAPIAPPAPALERKTENFYAAIDSRMTSHNSQAAMEEMQIQSRLRSLSIRPERIEMISIVRSIKANPEGKLISQVTVVYTG